jgi:Na+-translocating ferredoxin:NAD+ oxidoreductase subunit B
MADNSDITRRHFLRAVLRGGAAVGVVGALGLSAVRAKAPNSVWQIDPYKCTQCGLCRFTCVLGKDSSAVKCVHAFAMCGRCKPCMGYFAADIAEQTTDAKNQLCPTGAIVRRHVEDIYYDYTIREELCVGCGKCVKGCNENGNGSLFLQVRHDRCLNCNECAVARVCPSTAFVRVPSDRPYLMKGKEHGQ